MPVHLSESDVVASICRESFYEFVKEFWEVCIAEEPVFNWHIRYLCDEIQKVAERVILGQPKLYDLVINIPPGTTKSTIVSQMFPAWMWIRMPRARFICGSYAHAVALKDSLMTRDIVSSEKYVAAFGINLREDQNTKGLFVNTKKGWRLSVGVGGSPTGFHGHVLIVDDPINPEEAFSDAELKRTNRWMSQTLPSRKVDKNVTPTILVQQRLHQNDPTGALLEKTKGKHSRARVKHINLPGELTEHVNPPELAEMYRDGLLDPVRLSRPILEELQATLGDYGYAAQILQHPVPLGGGTFKVERFVLMDEAPRKLRTVRGWDKAGTQDDGDWTAGVKIGVDEEGFYWVVDVQRDQLDAHLREMLIKQTAELDGVDTEIGLEQEPGSGGKESAQLTVRRLAGFKVEAKTSSGSKEARAYAFASQVNAGNVRVLKRPWTADFIEEYRYFPNGRNDDQVDGGSIAFNKLALGKKKRAGGLGTKK